MMSMRRRIAGAARIAFGLAALAVSAAPAQDAAPAGGGWVSLFDGKTLGGWTTADGTPGTWMVEDGVIHGSGPVSHLFSPRGDYRNFRYRVELKIADKANSGMYFRTAKGPGFPNGYEAQVNSTHTDPVRTGSLYNFVAVRKMLVPPDTWFTQEIEAVGNHIIIKVNGETVVDFVDKKDTHTKGHFAFQQHDPGSQVWIRKIEVQELPAVTQK
ncbi:3-keto-disaccharide hydrolase [Tundrisphaera sp. TA3]|uniref:3-keto-disaccharide hydrolase n=1 Tax=Tundrisphaera sp. TA3 TaxID=3435775 RepID=UPI003EBFB3B7